MSLTPNSIEAEINRLTSELISKGLCDDQNNAFVRKTSSDCYEVTFANAAKISVALKDRDYDDIYIELADARAYNMKLLDGAIIQLMYEFKKKELIRHRLAFYPSPRLRPFQEDPESYLHDLLFSEIVSRRIVPIPFRFDYDTRKGIATEVAHPKCHFTLGQYENCRIPVTAPLPPYWFITFITCNFYKTDSLIYKPTKVSSYRDFRECIHSDERNIVHLVIPMERKK